MPSLPAIQSTEELRVSMSSLHHDIMWRLQNLYQNGQKMTEEEVYNELETIEHLKTEEFKAIQTLTFRAKLMEGTIEEVNARQASQLKRLEELEDLIVTPRESERKREHKHNARLSKEFARVMQLAQSNGRR